MRQDLLTGGGNIGTQRLGEMSHFVGGGLKSQNGKPLTEFEIAAADGNFAPAEAKVNGGTIMVQAENVAAPPGPLRLAERGESKSGQQRGPPCLAVPNQQLAGRNRRVRTGVETSVAFRSAKVRGFRGAKGDNTTVIDLPAPAQAQLPVGTSRLRPVCIRLIARSSGGLEVCLPPLIECLFFMGHIGVLGPVQVERFSNFKGPVHKSIVLFRLCHLGL